MLRQVDNFDVLSLRESDLQEAQTSFGFAYGIIVKSSAGCREKSFIR